MSGLQTKTFTAAAASLSTSFTTVNAILASTNVNMNVPEGFTKCVRLSMSCTPQQDSATDGISVFKLSSDGVVTQQIFAGPGWSNQAAGPLGGNTGEPVVIESASGIFDVNAGNAIDIGVGVTTAETCDVAISLTFA
jgi:hypothetical protein